MGSNNENAINWLVRCSASLSAVVVLASCGVGTAESPPEAGFAANTPPWIESLYPKPGAQMSSVAVIEVEYEVPPTGRRVRLIVDGVDVTTVADAGFGRFHYDPSRSPAPVDLGSGEHRAVLKLVRLSGFGDAHELIDEYQWSFRIL